MILDSYIITAIGVTPRLVSFCCCKWTRMSKKKMKKWLTNLFYLFYHYILN